MFLIVFLAVKREEVQVGAEGPSLGETRSLPPSPRRTASRRVGCRKLPRRGIDGGPGSQGRLRNQRSHFMDESQQVSGLAQPSEI